MTNPETDSSQNPIPNTSNVPETYPSQSESRVSQIRNYLSLFADIGNAVQTIPVVAMAILLPILLFNFRDKMTLDSSCIQSSNPLEILAALGLTVGLTVLGVALAPAAILSIAIWLVIKFSYFCG